MRAGTLGAMVYARSPLALMLGLSRDKDCPPASPSVNVARQEGRPSETVGESSAPARGETSTNGVPIGDMMPLASLSFDMQGRVSPARVKLRALGADGDGRQRAGNTAARLARLLDSRDRYIHVRYGHASVVVMDCKVRVSPPVGVARLCAG